MPVVTMTPTEQFVVDGVAPQSVWLPETVEQVAEAMAEASAKALAVIPLGNGTKRHIGLPPSRYDVALCLRDMGGIVEYSPDDLVVTVLAGTPLAELQRALAERGQFLPFDPPFPGKATIGGIIAAGVLGPCRCLYGAIRDHLLGIKVVQPDGKVTRFGGKVVKNVAGYDVTKVYVGSLGTLGVIVEATFKVRPLPETSATLPLWADEPNAIENLLGKLVLSDISPAFAELLNAAMWERIGLSQMLQPKGAFCLLLGFDGFREEVGWWLAEAKRLADEVGLVTGAALDGEAEQWVRAQIRDAHGGAEAGFVLKAILPSSEVCAFVEMTQKTFGEAVDIIAHSLNGIVRVMAFELMATAPTEAVQRLLSHAVQVGGNLVVEKAPTEWKQLLPVWGQLLSSWHLMQRLKATLDPQGILSPGRLF